MAETVLVPEPSPAAPPAQTVPGAGATAPPGPRPTPAQQPGKPMGVPNARKGYKLTLWVSATSEAGLADVHGLLQLDGADPIPFCQLKSVQNPLARALQEAFVAVERVRARPPRMTAPPAPPATSPRPQAAAPSPARAAPATPPASPARSAPPDAATPTTRTAPVAQPSLF